MSISRLVVIVALVAATVARAAPAPAAQPISCTACIIVDDSGSVLFARAAVEPRANASTTKIVTALVVRDRADLDELVTVSPGAAATGGGGLDLGAGDRYTVVALLHALLMTSSNEAAVALAEHVAGSQPRFVDLMNEMVSESGARATHFVTAHGLDMPDHYSSARDLAFFALELLRDPVLASIVAATTTTIAGPTGGEVLANRNVLLESYPGATGVKTGYTALAGDVLVASAERDGRSLVAVTMGAESDEAAVVEATALLERGWELLARTVVVPRGRVVATLVFDPAGAGEVVTARPIRGPWGRAEIGISFVPDPSVAPPLSSGDRVGEVVVRAHDRVVTRVPAIAKRDINADDDSWGEGLITAVLGALGGFVADVAS